jgi:hypothetical protein
MTRWKRGKTTTVLLLHAHNHWSNWLVAKLEAIELLGIPVAYTSYPNHYDGSIDREWYVPSEALNRAGGEAAIEARTNQLLEVRP